MFTWILNVAFEIYAFEITAIPPGRQLIKTIVDGAAIIPEHDMGISKKIISRIIDE